jgi:hypothetical protein
MNVHAATIRAAALRRALRSYDVADRAAKRATDKLAHVAARAAAGEHGISVTLCNDELAAVVALLDAAAKLADRAGGQVAAHVDAYGSAELDAVDADAVAVDADPRLVELARRANLAGQASRKSGAPGLSPSSSAETLIAWLAWWDSNGDFDGLSASEAWDLVDSAVGGA